MGGLGSEDLHLRSYNFRMVFAWRYEFSEVNRLVWLDMCLILSVKELNHHFLIYPFLFQTVKFCVGDTRKWIVR